MSISHETTYSEGPKSSYDAVHARNLEILIFWKKVLILFSKKKKKNIREERFQVAKRRVKV